MMTVELVSQYILDGVLEEVRTIPLPLNEAEAHMAHAFDNGAVQVIVIPLGKD